MSDPPQQRKSLVDYSKVADRPAQDARFAAQSQQRKGPEPPPSAQMDAVIRLMTGREERTIAEKLADANRPTWEQYKKDNHDKLNLDENNEQEMELYRRKLDEQRDRLLARKSGSLKPKKKKKKKKRRRKEASSEESSSDDGSESGDDDRDDEGDKKHKKKHKRKHKKRKHKHRDNSSSSSESEDSSRKHRKKRHPNKSKESPKENDDNHYKLSQFFSEGNENNS